MHTVRLLIIAAAFTAGLSLSSAIADILPPAAQTWKMESKTIAHMLTVLRTESTPAQMRAAMALGKAGVGSAEVVTALIGMLANEYAPARATAAFALGRSGSTHSADALLPLLADPSTEVRIEVCHALAALKAGNAAASLPFNDPQASVRLAALQAAEQFPNHGLAATLQQRFGTEPDPQLRARILECFTTWQNRTQALQIARSAITSDPDLQVQIAAANWFAALGASTDRDLDALRRALQHPSPLLRAAALPAVAQIWQDQAEADFIAAAADTDHMVRKTAALLLGQYGSSHSAEPVLLRLQSDHVRWVRRGASTALVQRSQPDTGAARRIERSAIEHLQTGSAYFQCEQLWLLGTLQSQLGAAAAVPIALRGFARLTPEELRNIDLSPSRLVAWLVGETAYEPAGSLMTEYFAQPVDAALRIHGARALGTIRYEPAVPVLSRLLKDWKVEMGIAFFTYGGNERTLGLWALDQIGTAEALATLTHIGGMINPLETAENMQIICDAIVRHKHNAAVQPLTRVAMLERTEPGVRAIIAKALEELTGKQLISLRPAAPEAETYDQFFLNAR